MKPHFRKAISQYVAVMIAAIMVACWPHLSAAEKQQTASGVMPLPINIPAPDIDAKAWVLMEQNSGWVVAGHNVNEKLPPASITKLMTNFVVFEKLRSGDVALDDQVSISEKSWRAEGSRMFADVNSQISLQHLLKSTIIQSGNDAAIALAEHIAGSEEGFAAIMNQAAQKLGLENSHFMNSTGLPDSEHYMSARDIAELARAVIATFPDYYAWYSEKEYTHNDIVQYNRNKLLWKDSMVDGVKTGHTEAAGYCLVGSAIKDKQRWIAVVLGSESERVREKQVLSLLRYGLSTFEPMEMFSQQGGVASVKVYKGEVAQVNLQPENPVNIVVPRAKRNQVETDIHISPYYLAPIEYGQAMGVASVSIDNAPVFDIPLIATSSIQEGGLWKRMSDSVKLSIRNFMDE